MRSPPARRPVRRPLRRARTRAARALAGCVVVLLTATHAGAVTEPPVIVAPVTGAHVKGPTVEVRGTSAGTVTVVGIFDGPTLVAETGPTNGVWRAEIPLSDGAHELRAQGRDAAGTPTALGEAVAIAVDSVAPAAPVVASPLDGEIVPHTPVAIEGTAEPFSRVRVEAATGLVLEPRADGAGTWRVAYEFPDSPQTLTARAIDAAGNVGLASDPVRFRVDTLAPAAPIVDAPRAGSVHPPGTLRVAGRAEPGTTVTVSDGVEIGTVVATSAGTWSLSRAFAEGTHTIGARARDAAGHTGPAADPVTFLVDADPPSVPTIVSPAEEEVVPPQPLIIGQADPYVVVQLLYGQLVVGQTTAGPNGAWSMQGPAASGPHELRARAQEASGSVSAPSPVRSFVVDGRRPGISITMPSDSVYLPGDAPLIEGTADDDVGVASVNLQVYDVLGRLVLARSALCAHCPLASRVAWELLTPLSAGRYVVRVQAVDRVGNRSSVAETTYVQL